MIARKARLFALARQSRGFTGENVEISPGIHDPESKNSRILSVKRIRSDTAKLVSDILLNNNQFRKLELGKARTPEELVRIALRGLPVQLDGSGSIALRHIGLTQFRHSLDAVRRIHQDGLQVPHSSGDFASTATRIADWLATMERFPDALRQVRSVEQLRAAKTGGRLGLATLCVAGGMGGALLVERLAD